MDIYAKISEKAKLEVDENGVGLPVYLNLTDMSEDSTGEENIEMISALTEVAAEFISLITEAEYDENAEEEASCCGCTDCTCDDDEESDNCCGGCSGGCCK